MSGTNPIDEQSTSLVFQLASIPARLLSRYRQDLRASLGDDAIRYGKGAAATVFAVLAILAVGYPVVASIVHALTAPTIAGDPLTLALRPFFEDVYSESLPFMVAVAGIGAFSPALGVLLILVFIPADLIAAMNAPPELIKLSWQTYPEPIFARLISYGLLWILAVEIPLQARGWALGRGARAALSTTVIKVVALVAGTAVMVFFWAGALPWLIQPVFEWSAIQQITPQASAATWFFWPILVIAAAVLAAVAAIWPAPAWATLGPSRATADPAPGPRPKWRVLVHQTIAMLFLAALLAGLLSTLREVAVLVAGLLVAGPVLTLLLPSVPVPAVIRRVPVVARWVAALAIALGVSLLIQIVAGDALYEDYFVIVLTLALVAPLFRLLLEAGALRGGGARPARGGPPPAVVISGLALLATALWLAVPDVALANNCPSRALAEYGTCLKQNFGAGLALLGGALLAAGGWLWRQGKNAERDNVLFGPPDYSDDWPPTPEIDPAKFKNLPPIGRRRR